MSAVLEEDKQNVISAKLSHLHLPNRVLFLFLPHWSNFGSVHVSEVLELPESMLSPSLAVGLSEVR